MKIDKTLTSKNLLVIIISIFILLTLLLILYFQGERSFILNKQVNYLFEKQPTVRWEIRKILTSLEKPFAYVSPFMFDNDLPNYRINISKENLNKIGEDLPLSINETLKSENKKSVNITFSADGNIYKGKLSVRGDNYNHWAFQKKSWRVELEDAYINRMSTFNLIIPEDRYFIQTLFWAKLAKRINLISPQVYFATLKINNQRPQFYILAQNWSPELIEENKRSDYGTLLGEAEDTSNFYRSVDSMNPFDIKDKEFVDMSLVQELFNLLSEENDEVFFQKADRILNINETLKWIALSTSMFSRSQKDSHNLVIYLDPTTGKISPVPWNVLMFDGEPVRSYIDIPYNKLVTRILKNSEWLNKRNKYVHDIIGDQKQLESDLSWLKNLENKAQGAVFADSDKLFLNLEFKLTVKKFRNRYEKGHELLSSNL